MIDVGSAIGYLLLDTSDFKKGFTSALDDLKVFEDKTAKSSDKLNALGSAFTGVGSTLTTSVTLPILGAGAAVTTFATGYEGALKKVQSETGATSDEMKILDETMKGVYESGFGESFEDVADSISTVRQQMKNLADNELESVVEKAITLRDTFGYEVNESVRTAETLIKNFGLSAEEAFDYISYGAQNGLDWSDELLDSINEYSPQFKKLGFDAEDMFNIFAKGAEDGAWNLDKIGDAIKEFSIRAVDFSETTLGAYEALGFAEDFTAEFRDGGEEAATAFKKVIQALREMEDPLEQNLIGTDLFGTMWEDLGPEVLLNLDQIDGALGDVSGSMETLMSQRYDSLEGNISTLKNNVTLLAVEFGEILLPYVNQFAEWLISLVQRFRETDESTKEFLVTVLGIAAALGPLLLIGGKILTGVANMANTIKTLSTTFSTINTVLASLGLSFSSIIAPILAVIAAVVALKFAWDNNLGGIQEKTAQMWESLQSTFNSIVELCASIGESLLALWDSNFLGIQDIFNYYLNNIQTIFQAALDILVEIFEFFDNVFSGNWEGAWENVKNIFNIIWDTIITLLSNFLNIVVDTIIRIGVYLWDAAKQAFEWIKTGFTEVWNTIMEWFGKAIEDPVGTVLSIGTKLFNAGKSIFDSLWNGLKSVWDSITSWVSDCIDWIADKVAFWESESSKLDQDDGDDFDGSHKSGLSYVPYDGYRAKLHEGERVLTKKENERYTKGEGVGNTYNFYSPEPIDAVQARREMEDLEKKLAEGL